MLTIYEEFSLHQKQQNSVWSQTAAPTQESSKASGSWNYVIRPFVATFASVKIAQFFNRPSLWLKWNHPILQHGLINMAWHCCAYVEWTEVATGWDSCPDEALIVLWACLSWRGWCLSSIFSFLSLSAKWFEGRKHLPSHWYRIADSQRT